MNSSNYARNNLLLKFTLKCLQTVSASKRFWVVLLFNIWMAVLITWIVYHNMYVLETSIPLGELGMCLGSMTITNGTYAYTEMKRPSGYSSEGGKLL